MRLALHRMVLLLATATFAAGCGSSEAADPGAAHPPQEEARSGVCPPCRMRILPHYEVIEVDGLRFGVCNPRCGEIVRKDAGRFVADALP